MGGAVRADQAGAVDRQQYRQLLQRDVVDQLVVGALQERGVDCHYRLKPVAGHACREREGMLLGNANVEIAFRVLFLKLVKSGTVAHGGRDADQPFVPRGHVDQPVAEHLRVGFPAAAADCLAIGRIEFADAVEPARVLLGRLESVPFLGDDVQELRTFQLADIG